MATQDDEERQLRSVALQNANAILAARQRAERELASERERLRITLASIGDAVISTDAEGRVTYLNEVAEKLTGWTQAEARGRPLPDVFHILNEQTREPAENPALRALREGVVVALANHTVLKARDGTETPIDDSAAPMLDESGAPVGVVLVFRDVTERQRDEEVRARLAAIVESSDDAIVGKTLDGVIRSWNAGAERIFGYKAEEAIGKPITLIIPPELLDEEKSILARLAAGERIEHYETVRLAKDGRRLNISLTVSPIRDAEGRIVGASKVARDVTERKWAEETLRASELRFRTLTSHAPVGIFLADREGRCLFVNERWCEMAGLSPEEALGQGWARALHPDDKERVFQEWQAAVEEGRLFAGEYRFQTPQGRVTWLEGNAIGLRDPAGRCCNEYIGTLSDITERRAAVESLKEADRRKDEFVALLAHELRNPLAPLRNGLRVMRLAAGDAEAVAQMRDIMDRQLSHMVRLVDDLLDVSRISRNNMELRRARVPLAEVVSSALETARPAIEAAGHVLTVSLPPEPVLLDADLTRLAQVFGNLLNNSAKYTERGGHIWLTATREGGLAVVAVKDDGIGIPAAALPNIFDIFSQVDRSIERTTGGLGIGLALVKGLVEMHGGTVEAASPGKGKGSTFTVRLPLARSREESSPGAPAEERPAVSPAKRRILVVDDNRDSALSMATMLRLLGNEVRTANDGSDGVKQAEEFRPQVILMDIGMPRLNGYEATRLIREQPWGGEMKVIALTAWSGQDVDPAKSKESGCDGHLVKPVNLADLENLLVELQVKTLP
jgi:PAS domain S-box-containing protein